MPKTKVIKESKLKEYTQLLIILGTLLSLAFGSYFYIDSRYALAGELKNVEQRLDYKIKSDQRDSIQQRLWQLEEKYGVNPPSSVQDEHKRLKFRADQLDKELYNLEKVK